MKNITWDIKLDLMKGMHWDLLADLKRGGGAKIFQSHLQKDRPINAVRDTLERRISMEVENPVEQQLMYTT